jgi:hypothetical protein
VMQADLRSFNLINQCVTIIPKFNSHVYDWYVFWRYMINSDNDLKNYVLIFINYFLLFGFDLKLDNTLMTKWQNADDSTFQIFSKILYGDSIDITLTNECIDKIFEQLNLYLMEKTGLKLYYV